MDERKAATWVASMVDSKAVKRAEMSVDEKATRTAEKKAALMD